MGLLLLAAGFYFLGTGVTGILAKPPDPPSSVYWWFVTLCVIAAGVWLVWRTLQLTAKLRARIVFCGLGLIFIIAGVAGGVRFTHGSPIHWIYYTPERLAAAQQAHKITVLEFTAAWCLNCHALEQAVLHNPRVVKLLNSNNVAPIKVDL